MASPFRAGWHNLMWGAARHGLRLLPDLRFLPVAAVSNAGEELSDRWVTVSRTATPRGNRQIPNLKKSPSPNPPNGACPNDTSLEPPMRTLTIALLLFLAASQASAVVNNMASRPTISPNFSGGSGPVDNIVQHPGTCDSSGSATGGFNSSGDATCHTEYTASSAGFFATPPSPSTPVAPAAFRDNITISAPGVPTANAGHPHLQRAGRRQHLRKQRARPASSWSVSGDIAGGFYDLARQGRFNSPGTLARRILGHCLRHVRQQLRRLPIRLRHAHECRVQRHRPGAANEASPVSGASPR